MKKLLLCIVMAGFMIPAMAQEDVSVKDTTKKIETQRERDVTKNESINELSKAVNNLVQQQKEISVTEICNYIFGVIGIISLFIACVAYEWSIKQNKKQSLVLDEHSDNLKEGLLGIEEQSSILDKHGKHLEESLQCLDNIRQNMFTTDIPDFPHNIKNIIDLIDECLNNKFYVGKRIEFEIFTDFPGYGILSYNDKWNDYKDKISSICRRKPTRWYFYNDKKQAQQREHQFEHFKEPENHDELVKFIDKCQKNALMGHTPDCCDTGNCPYDKADKKEFECPLSIKKECYYIKTMEATYTSLMEKTAELQQTLKEDIEEMENRYQIKVTKMDKELPFFGWFIVENIDNKRIPLKAIITFPAWGENCEKGFYTEKEKLLHVFYNTLHEHVKDTTHN